MEKSESFAIQFVEHFLGSSFRRHLLGSEQDGLLWFWLNSASSAYDSCKNFANYELTTNRFMEKMDEGVWSVM
jgi:hypothetical protein